MANTDRGRYRMRDWEQDDTQPSRNIMHDRDFGDEFQRHNFSRSYERDFKANDDREHSSDDYDESGYLPSTRPYEGLVGELSPFYRSEHYGRGASGSKQPDERIYDDINDHLTQHSYIDATEITVTVKNSEVTLEGTVPDHDQKHYAEDVAREVHGVTEVNNLLKVKKLQNDLLQNPTGKQ
jgi:hypothetical protein